MSNASEISNDISQATSTMANFEGAVVNFAISRIQSMWRSLAPAYRIERGCCCDCARPDSILCDDCSGCLACGGCWCDVGNSVTSADVVDAGASAAVEARRAGITEDVRISLVRSYLTFFKRRFRWHWEHHSRVRHFKTFVIEHLELHLSWEQLRSDAYLSFWEEVKSMA